MGMIVSIKQRWEKWIMNGSAAGAEAYRTQIATLAKQLRQIAQEEARRAEECRGRKCAQTKGA